MNTILLTFIIVLVVLVLRGANPLYALFIAVLSAIVAATILSLGGPHVPPDSRRRSDP